MAGGEFKFTVTCPSMLVRTRLDHHDGDFEALLMAVAQAIGERVKWVHPVCGFWMLKRSIADRKIAALSAGRGLYLGER